MKPPGILFISIFTQIVLSSGSEHFPDVTDKYLIRKVRSATSEVCPSNEWLLFNGFCYYLHQTEPLTFLDAKRFCENLAPNTTLVSIHDKYLARFLSERITISRHGWIGLSRITNKTPFHWADGSDASYFNFNPGQPYTDEQRLCTVIHEFPTGWFTGYCYSKLNTSICHSPMVNNRCGSFPCFNGGQCMDGEDSYTCECEDGFTGDRCETDIDDCTSFPCQNNGQCTDHIRYFKCSCIDGYRGDMCQIDPQKGWVKGVCPDDRWLQFKGYCYHIEEELIGQMFYSAFRICRDYGSGASLASIHDQELNSLLSRHMTYPAWIGLTKDTEDSPLEWVDGTEVNFTFWADDEPSNREGHFCGQMSTMPGKWKTVPCTYYYYFICQVPMAYDKDNVGTSQTSKPNIENVINTPDASDTSHLDTLNETLGKKLDVHTFVIVISVICVVLFVSTVATIALLVTRRCSEPGQDGAIRTMDMGFDNRGNMSPDQGSSGGSLELIPRENVNEG